MQITKHLSEHKNKLIYPALLWTFFVATLCLVSFNSVPKVRIENFDKLVHACFHFGIVLLWFLYFNIQKSKPFIKAANLAILFSLIFGILIEICQQLFTTSRKADVLDLVANTLGALLAVFFLKYTALWIYKKFN
jgi:VanZ family protein